MRDKEKAGWRRAAAAVVACAFALEAEAAPLELGLNLNGGVRVDDTGATLAAQVFRAGWRGGLAGTSRDFSFPGAADGVADFVMMDGAAKGADGRAALAADGAERVRLDVTLTSCRDIETEGVALVLTLPCATFAGGSWSDATGRRGGFPKDWHGAGQLARGVADWIEIAPPGRPAFRLAFPEPVGFQIQDNRKWGPTISLRLFAPGGRTFAAGETRRFACLVSSAAPDGVAAAIDRPVVISSGADWIPLDDVKDIEPGSALDFSGFGLLDAPAGKHGWLRRAGAHFAFERLPGVRQRFCGVNLCGDLNYPDAATADLLVTRLVRLGYNSVRLHHHDGGAVKGSADGLTLNEAQMAKLDYLLAKCFESGLYATTDLYVSREVTWRAIGFDRDGTVPGKTYKSLVLLHEPAYRNWETFARNFLTHVNPHTGRAYKDEPGLPLLSLVNEGPLNHCWPEIRDELPARRAWAAWLAERRRATPDFAQGLDDPKKADAKSAAVIAFQADLERAFVRRVRAFLGALGAKALLTSQNCGPHFPALEAMREEVYDYVDNHFYVDHPNFIGKPWSRPSRIANENPLLPGLTPPVESAFVRVASRPFAVSEWNFSGPGAYRGVAGLMAGSLAALQDWDALWRFDYSHTAANVPSRAPHAVAGYFDLACDSLMQASDRAFVCLFLRGDLSPLADGLATRVRRDGVAAPDGRQATGVVPGWHDAAWRVRTGATAADSLDGWTVVDLDGQLRAAAPPVATKPNASVEIDRERGSLRVVTPKTAGGSVPSGALRAGPVAFDVGDVAATVWASALDGEPIATSRRILVSHLTDLQADGSVFLEPARRTLLRLGKCPPVVRNGRAKVALALERAAECEVWALETSGRRAERVASEVRNGRLHFTADVKGAGGARMLYEVVRGNKP